MQKNYIGVIGGSGLYAMEALQGAKEWQVDTPYGPTSDKIVTGEVSGIPVAFLARHGQGHRLIPSEVPYRANIFALRKIGVRYLISLSAVGSLNENLRPLDMVLPDQFIDLTRHRQSTFFGDGAVAHVSMADPICREVSSALLRAIQEVGQGVEVHQGGTYVCIEGPQFSSKAESHWYRSMGASVIGMTNMPEAKLAREAQIAYASLAMVTDFDCWHPKEANVSAELAIANLMKNAERAQKIAAAAISILGRERPTSIAHNALASALVTPIEAMAPEVRTRVEVFTQA